MSAERVTSASPSSATSAASSASPDSGAAPCALPTAAVSRFCIARLRLLRRDVDIAEILQAERLHRAVRLQLVDRRIELRLQRVVALAQPECNAAAEDPVVVHGLADERETLAVRARQEAALAGRCEHERRVEAARHEVRI